MSKQRAVVLLCVISSLGVLGWWLGSSAPVAPVSPAHAHVAVPKSADSQRGDAHAHADLIVPAELVPQLYAQRAHWYDPAPEAISADATPLQWHASCAHSPLSASNTLEALLKQLADWEWRDRTPDDILVEEIVQFWQHDGRYFQLAGRWQRDQPASYELTHFRADNPEMTLGVTQLPLPGDAPSAFDVLALGDYLDQSLRTVERQGAKRGARLLHAQPAGADGALDLKLSNGQILSFAFGAGQCLRRNAGDAICHCSSPDADPHSDAQASDHSPTEEPYRVVD